ncbi:MAG: 4'-phosphopantetheinyl transferase superfamily protein, partial [Paracoccaceae bacterium]|nr:4'-phosphopantetheinyl transferase superfamily protein [Paracoccaceae bacterium]
RPDRAPAWPAGISGSISHCACACLAAVARSAMHRSLGLDVEPDTPLAGDLWDTILLAQERRWLAAQPVNRRGHLALLIFSAKEAAYKAQYPISETLFGFDAMHIEISTPDQSFSAEFLHPVTSFAKGTRLCGRYGYAENHLITAVTI